MEQRLDMVLAPERYGMSVTEICALWEVSRPTFYEWRQRYEREGLCGLEDRSSRPKRPAGQLSPELEALIVTMRKGHPRWGARRIRAELARQGREPPARSTIERVLVRNDLRGPPPAPVPPPRRFERERANELWQFDAKEWFLADGTRVQIISCLDDHSRYCGATRAFAELRTEGAIAVFDEAVTALGLPQAALTDRGTIFCGLRTSAVSAFERHLWDYGVCTLNGRPYHPQTQGKIERFQRTLGEWLEDEGPFRTLKALNRALDRFRRHYNDERPHQALGDRTPAEVWAAAELAGPRPELAAERCRREALHATAANGNVTYCVWIIGLGKEWAKTKVRVVDLGHTIEVRDPHGGLIRQVKPDPSRRYIGTGRPRGGPRRGSKS